MGDNQVTTKVQNVIPLRILHNAGPPLLVGHDVVDYIALIAKEVIHFQGKLKLWVGKGFKVALIKLPMKGNLENTNHNICYTVILKTYPKVVENIVVIIPVNA